MQTIICYTNYLPQGKTQEISFLELLLDEKWADGKLEYSNSLYSEIGNKNSILKAKQDYEFLLRAVKNYPLLAVGTALQNSPIHDSQCQINSSELSDNPSRTFDDFCTDCYIIGKYQQELRDSGYFEAALETLLPVIPYLPNPQAGVNWLKQMISHSDEYYKIDDNTRPFLIYRGNPVCYNQLNTFADEFAKALAACGERVEILDVQEENIHVLSKNIGKHFKAIIGFQTYLFTAAVLNPFGNLHDLITGPKFNLILDHPINLKEYIFNSPKDCYLLTHDRNYVNFCNKYYKNIKKSFQLAPGGLLPDDCCEKEKIFDISFIGTYNDYRNYLNMISSLEKGLRAITLRFLNIMKHHPYIPAEKALEDVLYHMGIELDNNSFLELLYNTRCAFSCIMHYFREKTIRILLDAGISIHVFGDSWNLSPFSNHPCLIKHQPVMPLESLEIMQRSKISLNIMAWHKDGLTERILNAMLCKSAVISDSSTALDECFINGSDLILFSLEQLNELPEIVKKLLADEAALKSIAENGYQKALTNHTWLQRASYFLQILKSITGSSNTPL